MEQQRKKVVFFGDSLTRADYLAGGFVELLASRWPAVRIVNAGVNGEVAADLQARVEEVQAEKPDRVYLLIGTNDCGWGVPAREYRSSLLALVAELRPAEIVLITPTTSKYAPEAIEPYVQAVKAVGEAERLPVIDFAARIEDGDYDWDGLHWNDRGHRRLADLIDEEMPA